MIYNVLQASKASYRKFYTITWWWHHALPLEYQNWWQEVASCDAMLYKYKIENNTQMTQNLTLAWTYWHPNKKTLYFTILMRWGLNFCNSKGVEFRVPKYNHTHDATWCGWMLLMTAIRQSSGVVLTSFTRTKSSGRNLGIAFSHEWRWLSGSVDRLGGVLCQGWLLKTLLKWDDYRCQNCWSCLQIAIWCLLHVTDVNRS